MEDAQAVICATGFSGINVMNVASVDEQGTINLVDAAKVGGRNAAACRLFLGAQLCHLISCK